jgi:hypothetical protein
VTAEVLVASPRFLTAPLYRHWHLRWGATDAEVVSAMPGDEIVPDASFTATRAITIAALPEEVWPWIVQIGTGRAGFYSYDLFDNAARPSADRILPEFQETQMGDWVPMSSTVNQTTAFKVRKLLVGIRHRAERLNAEFVVAAPIHHRHDVRPSANGPTAASDGCWFGSPGGRSATPRDGRTGGHRGRGEDLHPARGDADLCR